jgi:hypothetical protein
MRRPRISLALIRATVLSAPHSHLTMSNSPATVAHGTPLFRTKNLVSAARFAPGVWLWLPILETRGGRSAETAHGCSGTRRACRVRGASTRIWRGRPGRLRGALLRPSAEGRAPLGAPPWRFSAGVPRFHLRHFLRIRAASSSRTGRNACRAGSRASRACGYKPQPRDATPAPPTGMSLEDAPHRARMGKSLHHIRTEVNRNIRFVDAK